jgi:hypothetical protein
MPDFECDRKAVDLNFRLLDERGFADCPRRVEKGYGFFCVDD